MSYQGFIVHSFFSYHLQVAVKNSSNKKLFLWLKLTKNLLLFFISYFHKTYVRVSKRQFSSF